MQDIQNNRPLLSLPIDRVGVKGLTLPLVVSDRENGMQHTVASVDLAVDLPANFKGTHMSRFVEALENWNEHLNYQSIKNLLKYIKEHLNAHKAFASFSYTYFIKKSSPVSGRVGIMAYKCTLTGELASGKPKIHLYIEVPVMTVCPCSKAISKEGAHSQRAVIRMYLEQRDFCWLEEFVELAESSASSPVYPLLKRADEKFVTENSFANPCFVEDVVRMVANKLALHPQIKWYKVEVESFESIHAHNAFASIEHSKE